MAAAILAARKLAQFDRLRMLPASASVIAKALGWVEEIMKESDRKLARARKGAKLTSSASFLFASSRDTRHG
jgi:hypothetical protein